MDPKWLTAPQIRYLLAMKELDKDGAGVRSVQIASALGLSKPSIHTMLNTFREMGLIEKAEYGAACFTARGLDVVTRYSSYYNAVFRLLMRHFPPDEHLQTAVYAFLAEIPEENLHGFCDAWDERVRFVPVQLNEKEDWNGSDYPENRRDAVRHV